MKYAGIIFIFIVGCLSALLLFLNIGKKYTMPSVWINTWHPDGSRSGHYYNDLIKLNDNQYLFVGKDGRGKTFDSSIITINP